MMPADDVFDGQAERGMMLREPLHEVSAVARHAREDEAGSQKSKLACHGCCHCGEVHFEVNVDPARGTRKCNCSFCVRTRFWKVFVDAADFRLQADTAVLGEYRFGNEMVEHCFCKRCGTHVFMKADCVATEYVINATCLDDKVQVLMSNAPLRFEDGRNDDWWSVPTETKHL